MTATEVPAERELSPRLQQFQAEVEQLKLTGGRANPERTWSIIGGLAMVVGVVLSMVSWILTQGTESSLDFASYNAMGNFGMALTIAGTGLFLTMSLRRYFRYWLVRLIYEQRDQTDRIANR
ncbi:MAG: putative integral rane protein [Acidimicrobiales bacterium]|nr:putative integral rane protein [Acidimicrobiales bacterium]